MASQERVLYMLRDSDHQDISGPLLGAPGIDFVALAATYRDECYAQASAKQQDYCYVNDSDFVPWLIARGVVTHAENTPVCVQIVTTGDHRYQPEHWPMCPSCGQCRCEEQSGDVRHALNRWQWFRKCEECGHTFDYIDYPHDSQKPMLDDDGRDTERGCVPYTISQVGALPFPDVLEACRARGWSERSGMYGSPDGLAVAKSFGLVVRPFLAERAAALTVKQLLQELSSASCYIVATKNHWFPVVDGENRDPARTSSRSHVLACWEVHR